MLSNTAEGKAWLEQFNLDPKDKQTAELLLDSLILVDQADFEREMEKVLDGFLHAHQGQVALFVAAERPKLLVEGNPRQKINDESKPFFPSTITANNRFREPENYSFSGNTGSEGMLKHFCRDYAKSHGRVSSHPGLETMRQKKTRYIICIDDVAGSGNRMKEFAEWICEDRTIRSWLSFGWIKFIVLTFAASTDAHNILGKLTIISEILQCQFLTGGRSTWSTDERKSIVALCKRYAKNKRLGHPLGYKKAFSMILFSHGSPNTNPSILWEQVKDWKPLIPGTGRPAQLLKQVVDSTDRQQERLLRILGQTRMTRPSLFQRLGPESKKVLLVLSCIAKKKRSSNILSEMLGVTVATVEVLISKCRVLGWITDGRILTLSGRQALASAKRNVITQENELCVKEDFYFPVLHRSSARSSSTTPLPKGGSHGC